MADKQQFGMIGMAVMGRNLAMNVADNGYTVAVYRRSKAYGRRRPAIPGR